MLLCAIDKRYLRLNLTAMTKTLRRTGVAVLPDLQFDYAH